MAGGPAAFMSYVRSDDTHDGGQLTKFREQLAGEAGLYEESLLVIDADCEPNVTRLRNAE